MCRNQVPPAELMRRSGPPAARSDGQGSHEVFKNDRRVAHRSHEQFPHGSLLADHDHADPGMASGVHTIEGIAEELP